MFKNLRGFSLVTALLFTFHGPALARDLTLGLVPTANTWLRSEEQARQFAAYLESQLGSKVVLRLFSEEKVLHEWMNRYAQVDLAVLSRSYVTGQPGGEFFALTEPAGSAADALVGRQGLPVHVLEHLRKTLVQIPATGQGREMLSQIGAGVSAPSTAAKVAAAPAEPSAVSQKAVVEENRIPSMAASPAGPSLTLGFVPSAEGLFQNEAQARLFAGYLERRLGGAVSIRVFQNAEVLYDWMSRYREVDLALVDQGFAASRRGGELNVLADLARAASGSAFASHLVIRQGLRPGLEAKIGAVLDRMPQDSEGAPLLAALGGLELTRPHRSLPPGGDFRPEALHGASAERVQSSGRLMDRAPQSGEQGPGGRKAVSVLTDSDYAQRTGRRPLDRSPGARVEAESLPVPPIATKTVPAPPKAPETVPAAALPEKQAPGRIALPAGPEVSEVPRTQEKPEISAVQARPAPVPETPREPAAPQPPLAAVPEVAPPRVFKPESVEVPAISPITFGIVPDWSTLIRNEDQARRLGEYLQGKLGGDVMVRLFQGEQDLFSWLSTHRQVDMAVVRLDSLAKDAQGVYHLAIFAQIGKPRMGSSDMVMVQKNLQKGLLSRVQEIMVGMGSDTEGRKLLDALGVSEILAMGGAASPTAGTAALSKEPAKPLAAPSIPRLVQTPEAPSVPVVHAPPAAPEPVREKTVESLKEPERPGSLVRVESPAEVRAPEAPKAPVAPPVAPTAPRVEIAKAPEGAVKTPKLPEKPGAAPAKPAEVKAAAARLPEPAAPEKLPQGPPRVPSVEKPVPSVARKDKPSSEPAPAKPAPVPVAAEKPRENARVASQAPAKPVPVPPGLSPLEVVKEKKRGNVVYVAPFTSVMVPSEVAEGVFDDFVDRLNEEGASADTEFVILKEPAEGIDPAWLASRSYITGEIFGYVEDSGCCSTEVRAKSRVSLHRPGESSRGGIFEYPIKAFFDHDRSTLEQVREKISRTLASELSSYLLKSLGLR